MDDPNFIRGELSTDYLDRFKIFDKMNEQAKEEIKKRALAAVAAVLLQSEFVKKAGSTQTATSRSKWKMRG